jgi:hypothetical protein
MPDKTQTPRDRFDELVKELGEVFRRNRQDPNAVVEVDRSQFSIKLITVPGLPGQHSRLTLGEFVKQPFDAKTTAAKIHADYIAQRTAAEEPKQ